MTTQTTEPIKTLSIEPTWTDVCRAVFRSGKRQMSLEELVVTFLGLFRELQQRCPDTGYVTNRIVSSVKELHESGFLDGATMAAFAKELREQSSKR
jgi:hypothetical protein